MEKKEVGRPRKKTKPLHIRVDENLLNELECIVDESNIFNTVQDLARYLLADYVKDKQNKL